MVTKTQRLTHRVEGGAAGMRALSDAVDRFGERCGWSSDDAMAVQVSLDEILSNALKYGGIPGENEARLAVALASDARAIQIVVEDDGHPFDPLSAPRASQAMTSSGVEIGGRGLVLVRKLMDRLKYARIGETNRLTMQRQRRGGTKAKGGADRHE